MNYTILKRKDRLTVKIEGELDHHNCKTVRENVDIEIKSGAVKTLVFDFSGLSFMDSSGIGIIMGRFHLMSLYGGRVTIENAPEYVKKIIFMSGLKDLVDIA
ncbi:MAG: anti-sigma factor antagonist [Clostridia bacterium]|nr:anti-sigma factor antagonist [Clostridia bacterium]